MGRKSEGRIIGSGLTRVLAMARRLSPLGHDSLDPLPELRKPSKGVPEIPRHECQELHRSGGHDISIAEGVLNEGHFPEDIPFAETGDRRTIATDGRASGENHKEPVGKIAGLDDMSPDGDRDLLHLLPHELERLRLEFVQNRQVSENPFVQTRHGGIVTESRRPRTVEGAMFLVTTGPYNSMRAPFQDPF